MFDFLKVPTNGKILEKITVGFSGFRCLILVAKSNAAAEVGNSRSILADGRPERKLDLQKDGLLCFSPLFSVISR